MKLKKKRKYPKTRATKDFWVVHNPKGKYQRDGDPMPFDLIPRHDSALALLGKFLKTHKVRMGPYSRASEKFGSYERSYKKGSSFSAPGRIKRLFDLIDE